MQLLSSKAGIVTLARSENGLNPGKPSPTWQDVAHENAVVEAWWGRLEQFHFSGNRILYLKWNLIGPGERPSIES